MRYAVLVAMACVTGAAAGAAPAWKAGVAREAITPREPIWMAGFASRTHVSEGVRADIFAEALALEDAGGRPAVIVTLDLVAIDRETAEQIAAECKKRYGLERDRIVLNVSHTHSGPVAGVTPMPMYVFDAAQQAAVDRYTKRLLEQTVTVVGAAIAKMAPATIAFQQGLAGIAVNRRRVWQRSLPGPVDHDVAVLAVRDAGGALIAVAVGYACHATALNDYLISGDWPGFAREAIEKAHPGAVALFVQGCGADSNPLPRKGEELAREHGEVLAAAVEQALAGKAVALTGALRAAYARIDLPMENLATREDLEQRARDSKPEVRGPAEFLLGVLAREGKLPQTCSYPVQVWRFGSELTFIALGGEVVVDYSLRLKREYGFERTWVAGYSNDVPGYIPSRRVREEGGYEGGDALRYFGRPGVFAPEVEEMIVGEVRELAERTR